ncbi:TetR/AcrR family transcriptional regulator [Serratia rhizosphaerae]|uniref:TetR/AcrR family transcriptional regulator n=1 Tax=unclassified Serratia (in: enterobacteria) TaxID=2647522 RepID=UPI000CF74C87|nr:MULTISPECIES: TetR/AcrR family transcriptional regulator [unclassified Serratia (in: enterobacteria)]MBU3893019.1 TetR/AcrR family transcriptional regulator [Serratia rubidaea]AVJ16606.1 TetR family transcriptional regulator [Serratia sp. MYb239]MCA4825279.1 TetR/AcrR family transcriptional regulator [Serratia rubidaea]QNK31455.1 TetR/AcrR family transcriptional regulator [Serratia sp. JUb9]QPT14615.1 TetR/AcrR family transcriptional regulator [Serratia rubidaea]
MSSPTESRQAKAELRRNQIVAAAKVCFRQYGFHAASMAEIAQRSALSVGQIYRYFVNKDAIIAEIVDRIINDKMRRLEDLSDHINLIAGTLATRTLYQLPGQSEDDHLLMLEVTAEATRNPAVAAMLSDAEARLFRHVCRNLQQLYPSFSDEEIAARVEFIAVLSEGTGYRLLTTQKADPKLLEGLYQQAISHLFRESATPNE